MTASPPTWGQPGYQPPPNKKQPVWKRTWFIVTAALLALGLIGLVVLGTLIAAVDTGTTRVARPTATTIAPADPVETPTQDTQDTEAPETTAAPSGPPVVRVGDTLEMTDGFGDTVAEITVGGLTSPSKHKGVRFSTGDEYDKPAHGVWFGAWVKVKALQDGVETVYGDLHVAQGGRHYSGDACCPDGFSPTLDYTTLSKGEVSEGWVIFDIRSRKGEIVITNYDGKRLGAWKF